MFSSAFRWRSALAFGVALACLLTTSVPAGAQVPVGTIGDGVAATLIAVGSAATGAFLAMGVLAPFPFLPLVALGPAAVAALRSHRLQHEQIQTGLDQVLDRLERGEIKPEHALPGLHASPFVRIADEIRKTFEII